MEASTSSSTTQARASALAQATLCMMTILKTAITVAGFTWDGMLHKIKPKQWEAMLAVHCTAPFRLIQVCLVPCNEIGSHQCYIQPCIPIASATVITWQLFAGCSALHAGRREEGGRRWWQRTTSLHHQRLLYDRHTRQLRAGMMPLHWRADIDTSLWSELLCMYHSKHRRVRRLIMQQQRLESSD